LYGCSAYGGAGGFGAAYKQGKIKNRRGRMELNRKFRKLLNAHLRDTTIGAIMEPEVITISVSPGDGVIKAVEKMTEEGIGRLLVMEDDTLVGIVTRSSIMDAMGTI
jgi:predicted transcriptional regulator